ncbi:MAG: ABC transporter ATP-binding protein/permease [Cyanobacteriota bacterium]
MRPFKAFCAQLGKQQRLSQPSCLPLEYTNAWQFLLLVIALLGVVTGLTLFLITGAVAATSAGAPEFQQRFLPGVARQVAGLWQQPSLSAGVLVLMAVVVLGVISGSLGLFDDVGPPRPGNRRELRRTLALIPLSLAVLGALVAVLSVAAALLLALLGWIGSWTPAFHAGLSPLLQRAVDGGIPAALGAVWGVPRLSAGVAGFGAFVFGVACFLTFRSRLKRQRWVPWTLLGVIALLVLVMNAINIGISFIARSVDNTLVAYDKAGFWNIVAVYAFCLVLALPFRGIQSYLVPKLGLLWRRWLSQRLLDRYMENRAYYQINPDDETGGEIDNPDQRITQDTASFTSTSLQVTVGIIEALLTFFSFVVILWSISASLASILLVYAVGGTGVVVFISRRLVQLNNAQLRLEADFRYGMVHVRDNAESIAFYRGEQQESREVGRRLDQAIVNFDRLIRWSAAIYVVRRSYDYFSRFLPWLVIAPIYFAKEVDFGVFSQAGIAFAQVFGSLSFIVENIEQLTAFSASISRLESFQGAIDEVHRGAALPEAQPSTLPAGPEASREAGALAIAEPGARQGILVDHVDLTPPQSQRLLIQDLSLEVAQRQRVLVVGPSGCGKTSFLRLVSGLWPPARGRVVRPPETDLLFIPQKPYMILGSLREQLCYPLDPERFSDEQLRSVLEQVCLPELVQRYPNLEIKQDWPRILSLGEQQRLAFARLLLNAPRFVVLDEATSALDVTTERHLYGLLAEREMAFVSVGHRPTLAAFHDTVLELTGQGGWRLHPAAGYDFGRNG